MTSLSNGITREKILNINDTLRINNLHKKELNFKFVIIGDFGVGKLCNFFFFWYVQLKNMMYENKNVTILS